VFGPATPELAGRARGGGGKRPVNVTIRERAESSETFWRFDRPFTVIHRFVGALCNGFHASALHPRVDTHRLSTPQTARRQHVRGNDAVRGLFSMRGDVQQTTSSSAVQGVPKKKSKQVGRPLEARLAKQGRELASLRAQLARYQTALRGSNVTVYSQDEKLRYTSISNPLLGCAVEDILGKTDEEILPRGHRETLIALKRGVLKTGVAINREVTMGRDGMTRWFDLHIEPLRSENDDVIGLTCAAIDITERKEGEAHLLLLMRELTHRSKNLLAVIQAMARQTGKHAGTIEDFLGQFSERLQALAASHDLLIRESWYGASLEELARSQLGHYLEVETGQISLSGPLVVLKPEAAQSLGLALHELATNAAKYGALSLPAGRVAITWRRLSKAPDADVEVVWKERLGPPVTEPERAGFGTLVIERNLARAVDAEVDLSYEPDGLVCRIVIPATQLLAAR
jgi:PAS domain S-box-containing protein